MNLFEIVKCYRCNGTMPRMDTVILQTPKGRFRICKNCYIAHEKDQLKEQYEKGKENTKKLGLILDPYEMIKEKEKFLNNLKKK
jgi:hypothetical protein